jgi:hypothetical protein
MEANQLTVIQRAAVALGAAEHERNMIALSTKYADLVEIKNAPARDQVHSAYMELKNTRVAIQKAAKDAREDANQFSKAVIAEAERLTSITTAEEVRLQALRDEWDEAREAEKREKAEAEANRVAEIKAKIEAFMLNAVTVASKSAAEIAAHADSLDKMEISIDEFAEFTGEAQAKQYQTVKWLRERHADAVAKEAEAKRLEDERAELARLRAEQEERERKAAIARAEEERRAREIREQEEADRREAQRRADEALRAEREAAEAKLRAEREAHEAEMQAQRDEIARQQAEIAAAKAEQERIERERQAAIEAEERRKREEAEAAARAEADRIRAEQDAKIAEQKRRERAQFLIDGPGDEDIIDVLSAHYSVPEANVIVWLKAINFGSFEAFVQEQLAQSA